MRCHLIDALPQVGGQLAEIYPKKPIYDIPGYPTVMAGELVHHLMKQAQPFSPTFTLGERAEYYEKREDGTFIVHTSGDTKVVCKVIVIAGGLGSFEPRKPPIPNLSDFEKGKGVDYMIKEPELYRDKKLVLAGGGDSALDWTIELAQIAESITLVHRNETFRGAPDSAEKVRQLAQEGKINLVLQSNVTALKGDGSLQEVTVTSKKTKIHTQIPADYFIPLFGLTPKLGPIADWGFEIEKNAIKVNTFDYSTNVQGIYAIGDVNIYPGKLKLILCGFHEAALMAQSAFGIVFPNKKFTLKYTTVNGVPTI